MSITGVFLPLAGESALDGFIAANLGNCCEQITIRTDAKGGVGNGPNEHKKELAGSPQNDGTVERLGPIGSLHSGLEHEAKPSAAQREQRREEPELGSRTEQLADH